MIIYKTTNLTTGKIYVGQDSKNNPNYFGSGKYIYLAIKKHGKQNFIKEILCECSCKTELDEKEKYWIKTLNSKYPNGYNLTVGGAGSLGKPNGPRSEETKLKMRKPKSEETKLKMRKPKSEKAKNNMRIAQNKPEVKEKKRVPRSEESKLKIRKPRSEEAKQNMKFSRNSPKVQEKIRKPRSEEGKQNMKLGQQKRRALEKSKKEELNVQ